MRRAVGTRNAGGRMCIRSCRRTLTASTGALAWASTKVNIQKTGEWIRLPKFENTVSEFPTDEHQHVIKLTPVDGDGEH